MTAIERTDSIRAQLAEIASPVESADLRGALDGLIKVYRARSAALEEINQLVEFRIRAGVRGGELLRQTVRRGGSTKVARCDSRGQSDFRGSTRQLPDGIDKHTSSRWQKLVTAEAAKHLDAYIACCNEDGEEASEAGLLRFVRSGRKAEKKAAAGAGADDVSDDLPGLIRKGARFACVYADPPWQYGNQGTRGSTDDHYPTMPLDEICALPIADLAADDAHLHLWTTNAFLFDARQVIEAWGFTYRSCYVWCKPQMGMGNYWRVSHEFMLFATRGRLPFGSRSEKSYGVFDRSAHSRKPAEIRKLVEVVSPSPRIELFAREAHHGWAAWGNAIRKGLFTDA